MCGTGLMASVSSARIFMELVVQRLEHTRVQKERVIRRDICCFDSTLSLLSLPNHSLSAPMRTSNNVSLIFAVPGETNPTDNEAITFETLCKSCQEAQGIFKVQCAVMGASDAKNGTTVFSVSVSGSTNRTVLAKAWILSSHRKEVRPFFMVSSYDSHRKKA